MRPGVPVLYLPLAIDTKFNVRILRFMDAGVADFNTPVVVAGRKLMPSEFFAIWDEILALLPHLDAIDLQKISSNVYGCHNPLTYLDCEIYPTSGHTIILNGSRDVLYNRPEIVRMRKKLRRQHQRLRDMGTTEFLMNPSDADRSKVVDRLIALKRTQYLRTRGKDFFALPGIQDFYREMASPAQVGGLSHLSALTCGSEVVSAHLGFVGRNRFYYVLPAFDPQYRSLAVGHLLLDHLIEQSFETECTIFDLGEGDSPYKKRLSTYRLPLFCFEQGLTTAGSLYLRLRRMRRVAGISQIYDICMNGQRRIAASNGHGRRRSPVNEGRLKN